MQRAAFLSIYNQNNFVYKDQKYVGEITPNSAIL